MEEEEEEEEDGRTDGRTDGWTDGSRGEKRAKSIDTSSRVRGEAHFAHRAQTTHRGEANPCAPLPLEPVTRTINFHLLPSRLGLSRKDVRVVQRERVRGRERETERERGRRKKRFNRGDATRSTLVCVSGCVRARYVTRSPVPDVTVAIVPRKRCACTG